MSADNGIYIAHFPHGYRITEAGAIENIDYPIKGSSKELVTLRDYFGESKVYTTREDALRQADKLQEFYEWTEYGICEVGDRPEFLTEEELKNLVVELPDISKQNPIARFNTIENYNEEKLIDHIQEMCNLLVDDSNMSNEAIKNSFGVSKKAAITNIAVEILSSCNNLRCY